MNAKTYFERVHQAEKRLYLIRRQREHWAEMATKLSGVSDVKIQTTEVRHPTEDAAIHLADLHRELDEEEKKYVAIVQEAKRVIEQIPQERFREVLTLRYLCGHSWKTIWDEMDYAGQKSVFRVHGWALQAAQKILDRIPNDTK